MKHTVHEHKLNSGAAGLVVHVPGSSVVNLRVTFHSGFQYAAPDAYEVPHIMEHLLATVTKRHSKPNEFMIEAQKNGAYVNASTSADTNEYIYECAAFELDRIVDLIEEQVCEPLFAQKAFEAEKSNVREELTRNTTQHMSVCTMALAEQSSPRLWRRYESRLAQLDAIKLEQLEAHYRRTHTAANARFYLAGDFPDGGADIARRMGQIFDRMEQGERLELNHDIGRGGGQPLVTVRDIDQLYYRSGMYFGEVDEAGRAALAMLRMIMAGGMGSRVLGEARRRGLAYSVGAIGYAEPANSTFGFAGYVTPGHAEDLFEVISRAMREVADGACKAEELKAASDLIVGSITRSTQTAGDILQWYMDRYDEEGTVRQFEDGLEQLRQVKLSDISDLCTRINQTSEKGLSLLGRLKKSQAEDYMEILELKA